MLVAGVSPIGYDLCSLELLDLDSPGNTSQDLEIDITRLMLFSAIICYFVGSTRTVSITCVRHRAIAVVDFDNKRSLDSVVMRGVTTPKDFPVTRHGKNTRLLVSRTTEGMGDSPLCRWLGWGRCIGRNGLIGYGAWYRCVSGDRSGVRCDCC